MTHDPATWQCLVTLAKFEGDWTPGAIPYEVREFEHNMLLHGGVSNLWQALIGNGTTTVNQASTFYNTANAAIGVGDSATAAAATQTALIGTNQLRKGMNAGYPEHTPGLAVANKTIRFRSTFDTTEANFSWQEAGIFNSVTTGQGRMLNRRVTDMGTKTSASSFQITFDVWID